jgi:fumarylacetoacetase
MAGAFVYGAYDAKAEGFAPGGGSLHNWVVTLEALEPFRAAGPRQDPVPLPYLQIAGEHAFDIELAATLRPGNGGQPTTICRTNFRYLYWSMAQQLAHHTVGGCNMRIGDLLASGTISGPTPDSFGSLLELTWDGSKPLALADGGTRTFLENGDEVAIAGWCQADGYRIGFGEVAGRVVPASSDKA